VRQQPQCAYDDLFAYIKEVLVKNLSSSDGPCDGEFESHGSPSADHRGMKSDHAFLNSAQDVYAYVTPFIILVGIIGNSISLRVFCSPRMRKMSASIYLASLAISDTFVLLSYVLVEWLHRGMGRWPGGRSVNLPVLHPGTAAAGNLISHSAAY